MVNIGNWSNLTPELATSYYLYGTDTPPEEYRDRLKPRTSPRLRWIL